jgi:hypothetical protein
MLEEGSNSISSPLASSCFIAIPNGDRELLSQFSLPLQKINPARAYCTKRGLQGKATNSPIIQNPTAPWIEAN